MTLRLPILFCVLAAASSAATSTAWEVNSFQDFIKGRLSNLSLSADGFLQPGPAVRWNTALNQPALWSIVASPDGSIYAGTGHSGKVYRLTPDGKASAIWSAEQSEVFSLCIDAKGVLYAGTSPNGGVYRLDVSRATVQAREIWHSPAKYIWALQPSPDGSLFIATGEPGRIYRIPAGSSSAELYYDTGQSNVTALARSANGHIYAGTDPNGILYDIASAGQASILYDSALPEIRSLAVDPEGFVYAAALGGAVSTRTPTPLVPTATSSGAVVATSPTVITVNEAKASGVPSDNEQSGLKSAADSGRTSSLSTASATPAAPAVVEVGGVEKSALYRIAPNRTVETLRSSKAENIYDILLDDASIIFSTDDHGRVYRWTAGHTTLLSEPGDGAATRLLKSGSTLYAALSNPGRLLAFSSAASLPASYESPVHDSSSVARWGHLRWHGSGSDIVFRTRTGNAARPDNTWSRWSDPLRNPDAALISSPVARFVQWRAEWPAGSTAQLDSVGVPYLPQNGSPVLHSITVASILGTNPAKSGIPAGNTSASYSVTVTDTGEAPAASTATSASQSVSRLQTTQTQISWQADDPDNDKLVYSVYFRAEDASTWQLIRSRMFENTLLLDADVFADGRYFFKIVASDSPGNAAEFARQTELVSSPVLIDNTPPVVTLGSPRRTASTLDIDIEGSDQTSPLRLCEYSLDTGLWQPVEAVDGVTDSPHERFHLHLDNLRSGEHLLVVRVYDSANNAGLARIVLK